MIAEPTVIRDAIQSYAVILNRSQWLDESRMLMQEGVWSRLVKGHPGNGIVTLRHFESAMAALTVEHRSFDISVPQIVSQACRLAAAESDIVARAYAAYEANEPLLRDSATRLLAGVISGHEFQAEVRTLKRVVVESALDDAEVAGMVGQIDNEATAALVARRTQTPTTALTEGADADAVVADWLGR